MTDTANIDATASLSSPREQALLARRASLVLQSLPTQVRENLLTHFSELLQLHTADILEANKLDLTTADTSSPPLSAPLRARLLLDNKKISSVCAGIEQIAKEEELLGQVRRKTELTDGLILEQITVPIGVLLVIFESRPDVYPQLVALCIKTGNAILLKGGSEAFHTLALLHTLAIQAIAHIQSSLSNFVSSLTNDDIAVLPHAITLLPDRSSVLSLLTLTDCIDLIIPRGSSSLVTYIQSHTHIPVMGHAEGICHIYVHEDANVDTALSIIIDSKCDYPAACNAMETLLIHSHWLTHDINGQPIPSKTNDNVIHDHEEKSHDTSYITGISNTSKVAPSAASLFIQSLQSKGVTCYAGKQLSSSFPSLLILPHSYHHEYSDLSCTIEIVHSLSEAVTHINQYSSHHTDTIITTSSTISTQFKSQIDSAVIMINSSTRFSDGYRFGLGCEVGISTGRLHARGPVGLDGLCTYKWIVQSEKKEGHTVGSYNEGKWKYTHKKII